MVSTAKPIEPWINKILSFYQETNTEKNVQFCDFSRTLIMFGKFNIYVLK